MTERLTSIYTKLQRHPGRVVGAVVVLTALLLVPFLAMAPTVSASTEPTGDVFTARDRIDDTFVSSVHGTFIVVEDEGGDFLRAEPLGDAASMPRAPCGPIPSSGPTLFSYFEAESETDVNGILTLADLVDTELRAAGIDGIAAATDAQVKAAGTAVIDRFGERSDLLGHLVAVDPGRRRLDRSRHDHHRPVGQRRARLRQHLGEPRRRHRRRGVRPRRARGVPGRRASRPTASPST